jgi:hypothetical protein
MTSLVEKTCTPCRGGIPPLTRDEAESLHAQAPDWQFLDDAHRIERTFRLPNFREAMTFVQQVIPGSRSKRVILGMARPRTGRPYQPDIA